MPFRDELDAAKARIEALERALAEERGSREGEGAASRKAAELRAMRPHEAAPPSAVEEEDGEPPVPRQVRWPAPVATAGALAYVVAFLSLTAWLAPDPVELGLGIGAVFALAGAGMLWWGLRVVLWPHDLGMTHFESLPSRPVESGDGKVWIAVALFFIVFVNVLLLFMRP